MGEWKNFHRKRGKDKLTSRLVSYENGTETESRGRDHRQRVDREKGEGREKREERSKRNKAYKQPSHIKVLSQIESKQRVIFLIKNKLNEMERIIIKLLFKPRQGYNVKNALSVKNFREIDNYKNFLRTLTTIPSGITYTQRQPKERETKKNSTNKRTQTDNKRSLKNRNKNNTMVTPLQAWGDPHIYIKLGWK